MRYPHSMAAEMTTAASSSQQSADLGALFDGHVARVFADRDVEATMETMIPEPYVHCVPVMTGGVGGQEVRRFYSEHFMNQIPGDAKMTPVSRAIGSDQIVVEFVLSFTHDRQWDYLLPGVAPTGKRVDLPHVVVMKFENGKVAHERLYWDQASLLVQVGMLDAANLPVSGAEQAGQLLRVAHRRASESIPKPVYLHGRPPCLR